MGVACVQDIYRCDTCKSASDEYGSDNSYISFADITQHEDIGSIIYELNN